MDGSCMLIWSLKSCRLLWPMFAFFLWIFFWDLFRWNRSNACCGRCSLFFFEYFFVFFLKDEIGKMPAVADVCFFSLNIFLVFLRWNTSNACCGRCSQCTVLNSWKPDAGWSWKPGLWNHSDDHHLSNHHLIIWPYDQMMIWKPGLWNESDHHHHHRHCCHHLEQHHDIYLNHQHHFNHQHHLHHLHHPINLR